MDASRSQIVLSMDVTNAGELLRSVLSRMLARKHAVELLQSVYAVFWYERLRNRAKGNRTSRPRQICPGEPSATNFLSKQSKTLDETIMHPPDQPLPRPIPHLYGLVY